LIFPGLRAGLFFHHRVFTRNFFASLFIYILLFYAMQPYEEKKVSPKPAQFPSTVLAFTTAQINELGLGSMEADNMAAFGQELNLLPKGAHVIDLMSGQGVESLAARIAIGNSGRVIGLETNEKWLTQAVQAKDQSDLNNLEFRLVEDLERLPVSTASADRVISNRMMHYHGRKSHVFKEAFRVLKPGGHLCIADLVLDGDLPESFKDQLPSLRDQFPIAFTRNEYFRMIVSAGFNNVQILKVKSAPLTELRDANRFIDDAEYQLWCQQDISLSRVIIRADKPISMNVTYY
jgi:arsenite methyltransferase